MSNRLFLTAEEVAELTGIKTGRAGKTRAQRQVDWLRANGLPFVVNARGLPIITVAAIEGRKIDQPQPQGWTPRVLDRRAA